MEYYTAIKRHEEQYVVTGRGDRDIVIKWYTEHGSTLLSAYFPYLWIFPLDGFPDIGLIKVDRYLMYMYMIPLVNVYMCRQLVFLGQWDLYPSFPFFCLYVYIQNYLQKLHITFILLKRGKGLDLGWWTHNTIQIIYIIELYTLNLYNFINQSLQ